MSTGQTGPGPSGEAGTPSEEELRAAYEAEIKRIRVEQILLEQVVTLINMGMRRTGLAPGTEDERDLDQVRLAIEAVRLQTPLVEQVAPEQLGAIRDALSQLQMAFVRLGGPAAGQETQAPAPGTPSEAPRPGGPSAEPAPDNPAQAPSGGQESGDAGPAQRSGRLWIPGQ